MDILELANAIEKLKLSFWKAGLEPPTDIVVPYDTWWQLRSAKDTLSLVPVDCLQLRGMMLVNGVRVRPGQADEP